MSGSLAPREGATEADFARSLCPLYVLLQGSEGQGRLDLTSGAFLQVEKGGALPDGSFFTPPRSLLRCGCLVACRLTAAKFSGRSGSVRGARGELGAACGRW